MVKVKMVRKLIADKRLDSSRLGGELLVAIDGTDLFTFGKRHCEHCLEARHENGAVTFSHKMLEAKIVADIEYCGMRLHAMFCENHVRAKDAELTTRWCWLTDIRPCADNIEELVNIRFSSA